MVQQHTASNSSNTIWRDKSEESFMQAIRNLFFISKQTPGGLRIYDRKPRSRSFATYHLPFEVECQVAQDLAFIAAYEEQASAVSAVSITEQDGGTGTILSIASNAGVGLFVQESFRAISKALEQCA